MDLELEKNWLLSLLDVPVADRARFHFSSPPGDDALRRLTQRLTRPAPARVQSHHDALRWVSSHTDLYPVGMAIGPFSLVTKLVSDPITPVFLAGEGVTAEEDDDVLMVERALELATRIVLRSVALQIAAGARAVFIAEPAANRVYFSPRQFAASDEAFRRFVLAPNARIATLLDAACVGLLFHCCGELEDGMLSAFCELRPDVLSLGSSRHLWKDASLVPKDIVLFGNLPSKRFYSDDLLSVPEVARLASDLRMRMAEVRHPFILSTECDTLAVHGTADTISAKVEAMLSAAPALR